MSQVAGPWIRDSFRWQWRKTRSTHLYRGHIRVASDPWRKKHTHTYSWLMADRTCYAILTAGVWEATLLTHRQVISIRCKKGTGSSSAKGLPPPSLSFVKESEARVCSSPALISRSNDRPCRYFAHPSNFIRFATAY